eukprot:GHRR01035031.1.p1 GENE.GHRR01035031.1~~GHRR01035031.1.p1  ORF type:complete len:113 (-),score=14.99 GHRR01035031.1:228-566(-)
MNGHPIALHSHGSMKPLMPQHWHPSVFHCWAATNALCCMQVVAVAATFCQVWSSVASLVAELDVLAGFADLATSDPTRPYCKPRILELDDGEITLKVSKIACAQGHCCNCCG